MKIPKKYCNLQVNQDKRNKKTLKKCVNGKITRKKINMSNKWQSKRISGSQVICSIRQFT